MSGEHHAPTALSPRRNSSTHRIGAWVGPRSCACVLGKKCVKLIHRSTKTSDPHATTQRIVPPPKHRAWNIADWRENHTTYNTVQLHIQFRAPDDGQWWPETCTAFLTIKIVNLSHLVGHIYHLYKKFLVSLPRFKSRAIQPNSMSFCALCEAKILCEL
jgi:hypothetical protein